jgi:nucleoside-diphosphate-sugar epimerase
MRKDVSLTTPKLLLTGATGWLGRRVVEAVLGDSEGVPMPAVRAGSVRALVPTGEPHAGLLKQGIEVVQGDIRDEEALAAFTKGADGGDLIHLAGLIHPPGRTALFEEVNHRGTMALHAAARRARVRRMVAMSSNSPVGFNPHPEHRFDETSPYRPYMGYGRSKMRMEQALRAEIADPRGPEVAILRAPWFYGPGQPPRQTLFFTMIKEGKFPIVGSGRNRRSMGYTDNLAQGILLAAARPQAAGQIYWLADESPYAMNEIVETVRAVLRDDFGMKVSGRQVRVPGLVADMARLADASLQAVGLYHQKIHVLSEMNLTIACDIGKAKRELGYRPAIALEEGMRRSVAWCLAQGLAI